MFFVIIFKQERPHRLVFPIMSKFIAACLAASELEVFGRSLFLLKSVGDMTGAAK